MIHLYKGSIPEVIDEQSRHYPFFTEEFAHYKKSLPSYITPLLGVIRRNGESEFFYGTATPRNKTYYVVDFYLTEEEKKFTHITTIGKEENAPDKNALIDCFNPNLQAARVHFTLKCLKEKQANPAKYWMPKLLEERITEQNEPEYRELLSHLKETSTDIDYLEKLIIHIFRIRPNPCTEKEENFVWIADAFAREQNIEKALFYYKAAYSANPNSNKGKTGLATLFYAELTNDVEAKRAFEEQIEELTLEEKVTFIIECIKKKKEKIVYCLVNELLNKAPADEMKRLIKCFKNKNLHLDLAEKLIHHLFPKCLEETREKAAHFSWLGEMFVKAKEPLKGERYFRRSLQIDPLNAKAKVGLALLYYSGEITGYQNIPVSRALFEEAIKVAETNKTALTYLSYIYMNEPGASLFMLQKARAYLNKLLKLEPRNSYFAAQSAHLSSEIKARTEEQKAVNAITDLQNLTAAEVISSLNL